VTNWINDPNAEEDIPIITPGNVLTGVASGNNQYGKASLGYLAVKDMLGDVLFKKCLHAYMQRWNGKHPIPWDFFYTFNDVSGKNLNWFWSNWFFSNGYIDLAIEKVVKASGGYSVHLRNIGGFAAPVNVIVTYTDGQTESFHQTSAIWEKDQQATKVLIKTSKTISSIKLDGEIFMDADLSNNSYHL
jgi:aminopeptidase N